MVAALASPQDTKDRNKEEEGRREGWGEKGRERGLFVAFCACDL